MTIRKIASLANVSPATVSLVLNDKDGVGIKTRKKVQEIIDQYNYAPSTAKRKSAGNIVLIKYRTHGMAVEENEGFIASIIDQIENECSRFSYDLSTVNCTCQIVEKVFNELYDNPPMGIILLGTEFEEEHIPLIRKSKVPLVVFDNSMGSEDVDSVVMANENIARSAVKYLYDLGHREIGHFKTKVYLTNLKERNNGYLEIIDQLGMVSQGSVALTPTLNGAYLDMKKLLASGEYIPKGAVFADNDSIAIGATKAILEAKYSIPEDISIVGVDDIPFSAVTMPALTTVRISRAAIGVLVVALIRKRIKYPDWPAIKIKVNGEIIVRESTAKYVKK